MEIETSTAAVSLETAYSQVQNRVGLFDASATYGRLFAKGKDALDLLHRMSTNDIKPIEAEPGRATMTVLTNEKARIVDVLTVVRDEKGDTLLVTSHSKEHTVMQWLDKFTIMEDASFPIATELIQQFALYGPHANTLLKSYTDADLGNMPQMNVIGITIAGAPVSLLKAARMAESGWWIFVGTEHTALVKNQLEADVLSMDGAIITDELYEILRIEAGVPRSPSEINEKHNPLETTLVNAVSFKKGCYIGQEVIARLDSFDKVQRRMMGVIIDGELAAQHPDSKHPLKIESTSNEEIGEMTSDVFSPGVQKYIGLAFIRAAFANHQQSVMVKTGDELSLPGKLVKLPFDVVGD